MKIVEKPPRNSAALCGGGQGLSWAVEPRKEQSFGKRPIGGLKRRWENEVMISLRKSDCRGGREMDQNLVHWLTPISLIYSCYI